MTIAELQTELEALRKRRKEKELQFWRADEKLTVARFELKAVDRAIRAVERQIKRLKV
jgi:predicted  nucleic acid-binding Zn-ribbon protein